MTNVVLDWYPLILRGLTATLTLLVLSGVICVAVGFLLGLARLAPSSLVRGTTRIFVEALRGNSIYVLLFWLYFVMPYVGFNLSVWTAAVLGLGLNNAAYASEHVRACILAVPIGQWETAHALGMTPYQRMRYVILPQALAAMAPLFGNQFVLLLKATSVASLVTMTELTQAGRTIVARTLDPVPAFGVIMILYFVMALSITRIMDHVGLRLSRWRNPGTVALDAGPKHV